MSQPVSTLMLKYAYLKPRYKFGKQCIFETTHGLAVENIQPNPEYSANFIQRTRTDNHVQFATQFAIHTAQTSMKHVKDTGTLHVEGGWPKEVNRNDGEAVHRYRRRVEKDPAYASSLMNLIPLMEYHVCQNNAVNIHTNFFDDMFPSPLVKQYDMRIWNSYEDPQKIVRPIRSLSWSPNGSNRLAAAYSFTEFEEQPVDLNTYSYVWDIGNAMKPMIALETSSPMLSLQFNPRDISMLISGHMSGQVCCWDIRIGGKPLHTSPVYYSHRSPATKCLWISSKANTEFFSASSNGTIMWWDIRFMKTPLNVMVIDLDQPKRNDRFKAVGVTALHYEPTMSNKFLVGLVNGLVFNINRKNVSHDEQFTMKFECYAGPVHAIDRNPFAPKNFLTIGDWSAKLWTDDAKDGFLVNTSQQNVSLTGGCWSRSRGSIFFTTKKDGLLEAFDILTGMQKPLTSINVCSDSLTAISSNEDGELLAVGSSKGTVYVLECLEGLTAFSREDKGRLSYYLEGSSRFEKVLENKMKELRLYYSNIEQEQPEPVGKPKAKNKRDSKIKKRADDKKKKPKEDKKLKKVKSRRKETFPMEAELVAMQKRYFDIVAQESAKMVDIDVEDSLAVQSMLELRVVTKSDEEEEAEEEVLKRERSQKTFTIRRPAPRRSMVDESELELESIMTMDQAAQKDRGAKRRSILKSCPIEVCKPEICCKDVIAKRDATRPRARSPSTDLQAPKMITPFVVQSKSYQTLAEYTNQIEKPTREVRRNILKQRNYPPNVLKDELVLAKAAVRAWQEDILAGKLSFRAVKKKPDKDDQRKMTDAPEKLWDKAVSKEEDDQLTVSPQTIHSRSFLPYRARRRKRKSKSKVTLEDEIELAEQEKQETWRKLKQMVKEFEATLGAKYTYPRISTARRHNDLLGD